MTTTMPPPLFLFDARTLNMAITNSIFFLHEAKFQCSSIKKIKLNLNEHDYHNAPSPLLYLLQEH